MREWWARVGIFFGIIELTAIIHDQFSVHICPGYWQPPHHALIFGWPPPVVLGLLWGVWASWWFALPAALLLGWTTSAWERRKAVKVMAWTCGMILAGAFAFWGGIYLIARETTMSNSDQILTATGFMHAYSYMASFLAIIAIAVISLVARVRAVRAKS